MNGSATANTENNGDESENQSKEGVRQRKHSFSRTNSQGDKPSPERDYTPEQLQIVKKYTDSSTLF